MLAWPALADARVALPEAELHVLVAPSVEEIAKACPYVDRVVVDSGGAVRDLQRVLRLNRYDAAVALFSTGRVARALWGGGISYRLGPATKLHQFLFNQRLKQRRSQSAKPEYEYNRDLVRRLLEDHGVPARDAAVGPPYWSLTQEGPSRTMALLQANYGMPESAQLVIIHPGSGGSARNLDIDQYAGFANHLSGDQALFILVTAGPGEGDQAEALAARITAHESAVHRSTDGLVAFSHVLALAKLFVSGSTGPLHMAGALDVATLAFYPRRRSATALRWQTINQPMHRLAFSPPLGAGELDMQAIDVKEAAAAASENFLVGSDIGG